jgi:steroid delta-isomerase-like uncharacterized protein
MNDDLRQRRLAVLERHFRSEVDHDWDTCLATFAGRPRYEIVPTGQVHEGKEAVLAYHRAQRVAFPDQRHENVRFHFADDAVIAEFDLLGTNTGEFLGLPPTGKAFRVPTIAVFSFDGDGITNERVYLDLVTLLTQIGRTEVIAGSA